MGLNSSYFFSLCLTSANPPFNLSGWGADKLADDVRWQYGTPPASNANFAWLQHMIWHLAPNGRIGMVLANGSLSSQSGGEGEIRKNIINADLVDCIVAMPTQLFYIISNLYIVKTFGRIRCELAVCFFRQVCSKGMGASPIYF